LESSGSLRSHLGVILGLQSHLLEIFLRHHNALGDTRRRSGCTL
jgi:hypothetical protein